MASFSGKSSEWAIGEDFGEKEQAKEEWEAVEASAAASSDELESCALLKPEKPLGQQLLPSMPSKAEEPKASIAELFPKGAGTKPKEGDIPPKIGRAHV